MNLNKEEPPGNLQQPEVDLDSLLTSFLDKEIGQPSEKGELTPDLDFKLQETLREIGMVNATCDLVPAIEEKPSPPPNSNMIRASVKSEELPTRDHTNLQDSVSPQGSIPEKSSTPPLIVRPTLDLGPAIRGPLVPEKGANRQRPLITRAIVAGFLVILGIGGYLWLEPGNSKKPGGPVTSTQSGTVTIASVPTSTATGQEISRVNSPESSVRKSESRGLTASGQKKESSQKGITPSASLPNPAAVAASNGDFNKTADLAASGTHSSANTPVVAVPVSPVPPSATRRLVPDLPSPESNATIAIKDLSLPKPTLGSATEPEIALPTAISVEPARSTVATPAVALSKIHVVYPEMAKRARVKGTVDVDFLVDKNGKVTEATAKSGPLVLRKAAEEAVFQTRFRPATSNGVNVPAKGKITLVFNLENQ